MKITEQIHQLRIDFEIVISPEKKLPRFVNILILFGDKITLIDTGVLGTKELIFNYIKQNNRQISDIETIILSHAHPDHIGNAAEIKEITGCKIFAHELEKEWIENIDIQFKERPVPGFYNLVNRSVKIDGFLNDNQVICLGHKLTLKIFHSPGHSKGSINIHFIENNILFTADSIPLMGDIPNYDNYGDLLNSLQKIRNYKNLAMLLSSWTSHIDQKSEMDYLINEGEAYLKITDAYVNINYKQGFMDYLAPCKHTLNQLGLPEFLANAITDKAFRSHLAEF